MHYQIVYMKRGFPLTTWASSAERANERTSWPNSSAGLVIPWTCGSTPKRDHGKPIFDPCRTP